MPIASSGAATSISSSCWTMWIQNRVAARASSGDSSAIASTSQPVANERLLDATPSASRRYATASRTSAITIAQSNACSAWERSSAGPRDEAGHRLPEHRDVAIAAMAAAIQCAKSSRLRIRAQDDRGGEPDARERGKHDDPRHMRERCRARRRAPSRRRSPRNARPTRSRRHSSAAAST